MTKALGDANVKYTDLKQAVVGYVYGRCFSTAQLIVQWPRMTMSIIVLSTEILIS